MCFTGFPTETLEEGMDTVRFLDQHRSSVAAFIVGEFDLTHGALVAQTPTNFGMISHCENLARTYEQAADENLALAKMHRQVGAEVK